jgi:hypothetical protein
LNLTDIATVASIISSAALTISLMYVAMQVRQAEKNQRGLMQQGRADRLTMDLMHIAEPQMASVWIRGLHAPETLTGDDLERYLLICRAAFLSGEDSFLQHQAGLFDDAAYRSFVAGVRGQLTGSKGMRAAWQMHTHQFGAEFAAFMNEMLAQTTPQSAGQRLQQWASALEEKPLV